MQIEESSDLPTNPSVTVVVPCWNAAPWVEKTIRSIIFQSLDGVEAIVVDDGSTDESLEIARRFEPSVRVITGPNRGAPAARNTGLALARGEFVMFLDADDYIDRRSLECLMSNSTDADVILGPWARERDGLLDLGTGPSSFGDMAQLMTEWRDGRFTPPCSVLWRKCFVQAIGGWNERLLINQDGELVARAILNEARVAAVDCGLGVYLQHEGAGRVSRRFGRNVLESEMKAFENLAPLARRKDRQIQIALGRYFYSIALRAFVASVDDVGQSALSRARDLGFKGHSGTKSHVIAANLIGLPAKMRLSRALHNFRRRQT